MNCVITLTLIVMAITATTMIIVAYTHNKLRKLMMHLGELRETAFRI
jgi:hypothetical protein